MVAFKGVPGGPVGASSAPQHAAQQLQVGKPGEAAGRASTSRIGNALALEDVDVDLSEVYFLIMHFLSGGPCQKAFTVLWNELLQHKLLPRRYHALYSKLGGSVNHDENDDGLSYPLNYSALVERNPHIDSDHLIKLLKQLLLNNFRCAAGLEQSPSRIELAAHVPTLVGEGSFSLLDSERSKPVVKAPRWMTQFLWPGRSVKVNQVDALTLRQISGGFSGSHRSPSQSSSNYLLLDPPTLVSKITAQKKILGHRNAVYCAIFDRRGQLVITGSDDRLVKIWSATSGLCLRGCRGHEGDITDLAVSSCNTMVASASNDCTIRVWSLKNGWPLSTLRGHQKPVTQIQFSPQRSTRNHLLSSSDDGTCRIWNVSNFSFCLYRPRPEKDAGLKATSTPPQAASGANQFVCCAFNGDGSLFVTGSSDKYARVWQAPTGDAAWNEHPIHELDRLEGHANEVNYVQFSGCAAIAKTMTAGSSQEVKEEQQLSSLTWRYSCAIVTCSRDGSAIIWTPRRRRQVNKDSRTKMKEGPKAKEVKHWKKAFHLKVPNPPLPPQLSRGGGARKSAPTLPGVNMIVWSLDNRFVLAIMDCRICVWNSVDGTLVHCLTGHTKATYVLDVHPFDPRIAMSAGYDGRVIIWDIHKGLPITQFETGDYELVDGNFSPDGTSLVVSDEVGQMHLFAVGDEERTWKDAKYDQFFLGDYRPLVRDTFGGVLDQETQMPPAERNLQDLLCDASMIPYPEPYQSLYQQLRLGAIGMEWERPAVMLAVGMTDDGGIAGEGFGGQPFLNATTPERRGSRAEPPIFIDDIVDWEPELAASSEDGSDYSASEDRESQDDGESLKSLDNEEESGDTEDEVQLRRSSRRNKRKAEDSISNTSRRKLRRKSRHQVVEYPYERHYERRSGQGRHVRSNGGGTSAGAVKEELPPRSKRKAARRALRLFKHIPNIDDVDDDDDGDDEKNSEGDKEDEEECKHEGGNDDGFDSDQACVSQGVEGRTLRTGRRGTSGVDYAHEDLSAELAPSAGKQQDAQHSVAEGSAQDATLRENLSGFGEFCRVTRPRSQRPTRKRLVLKLKNKFAGSDQELKAVHEGQDGSSIDPCLPDNHKVCIMSQPIGSSSKPPKKLVVKYPKPSEELKDASMFNVGSPCRADLNGRISSIVGPGPCDVDEAQSGSGQDDKRKWEWKKGKAAKRVRLECPPGEADAASAADDLAGSGDERQADSPVWNAGDSRCSQPHLSVDAEDTCGSGRRVSRSLSSSSEPSGRLSSGGVGLTSVPPCTNVTRRSRNLLLAESEDETSDAQLPDVQCTGHDSNYNNAGGLQSLDVHGCTPSSKNGTHSAEFRSSTVIRASPMRNQNPGLAESDVAIHSKLSNGVKGLRVRIKASPSDTNCRMSPDTEHRLHSSGNCAFEDSAVQRMEHMTPNDERSPEGSEINSPLISPRCEEAEEDQSAEDQSAEDEDAQEAEDEEDDEHEEHEEENTQDEEGGDGNEFQCGPPFGGKRSRGWTRTEDPESEECDAHSDDLHSPDDGYALRNSSHAPEEIHKVGSGRQGASIIRQMTFAGAAPGNSSRNMMQTRRMTQLLAGKNVSDRRTRSGGRGKESERARRSRVDQTPTVPSKIRPQRQQRHVDTESCVHNLGRLQEDKIKIGTRSSARTRLQDGRRNFSLSNGKEHLHDFSYLAETHCRAGRNQKVRRREDIWLLSTKETGVRYVPQVKDEVVYFRQGHEQFMSSSDVFSEATNFQGPWETAPGVIRAVELCRVEQLDYKLHPKSKETYCELVMEFIDSDCDVYGVTFKVNLPILKNCPDFIVERKRYDTAMAKTWSVRDHCQVWWAVADVEAEADGNGNGKGAWWIGRIKGIKAKSSLFPDSPWEKYEVQYRSTGQKDMDMDNIQNHSPWELYEVGQTFCDVRPQLDERTRTTLLEALRKLEFDHEESVDEFGIQELEALSENPVFVNKTALPLSLRTVKGRLEDSFYHDVDQFNHDLDTIVFNVETFCGRDHQMPRKLRNLRKKLKAAARSNHRS